jgi:hypothetical protein
MPIAQLVIAGAAIVPNYAVNVLHYNVTVDPAVSTLHNLLQLITAFRSAVEGPFLGLLPDDVVLRNYSAKFIDSGGSVTSMLAVNATGAYAGDGMVAGVAANIAIYTQDPLNEWGHIYTMGVSMGALLEGVWDAGMYTAVDALQTSIKPPLTWGSGGSATFGVYKKKTHTFHAVNELQLRPKPCLLNKRLRPVT